MALTVRRRGDNGLSAWPGYVDALSTLLMVIIFVLLVFVLAQGFLSVALTGRNQQLDRVNRQLAEVSDMLSLERGHNADLQQSIAQLNSELTTMGAQRDTLSQQFAALKQQAERTGADRDALRAERDRLSQQLTDAALQSQSSAARLAEMQKQLAELDKTVKADKETISARLSDLAKLAEQNRALAALRDELEKQAQDSAARAMTDQQRRAAVEAQLSGEKSLGDSARAQIALLNRQVDELKAQLTIVAHALELSQTDVRQKDTQIANLGQKLNVALASKVEELQRYRSDFFGKLRTVLANRPGVQIVGDRFVFQSEVLFPVGSAELTQAGQAGITALAITIKDIAREIPPDINWIMRIDGHTDRQPIRPGFPYASNWELSTARAISVVKLLIADGVPAAHLAATGFADNEPLDPADTPDAYAKNRRIEVRLTDR